MNRMRRYLSVLVVCLTPIVALVVLSLVWPYSATEIEIRNRLLPPVWLQDGDWSHPLGTDQLGRDMLARLIDGGKVSVSTGVAVVLISGFFGSAIGIIAGFHRGWTEAALMRVAEAAVAFPGLLVAVMVLSALGPTQWTLIVVLSLLGWMGFARISHDLTVEMRQRPFVKAADGLGMHWTRILWRHVLPNQSDVLLTVAVLEFAGVILAESSLSYLGMGIQPPQSSWGLMVAEGQSQIATAWWLVTLPGLMIAATVLLSSQVGNMLKAREGTSRRRDRKMWRLARRPRLSNWSVGRVPPKGDVVLEVRNLTVEYAVDDSSVRVLDGVGFTLKRGQTLGVVGESGSGKSTLVTSLFGLLPPNGTIIDGTFQWYGEPFKGSNPIGSGISLVLQDPARSLNPLMPVGRQVLEVLTECKGMSRQAAHDRTIELFSLVELPDPEAQFNSYAHEMSGGMCQRVMIAMALALEPEVLIADEPTSALDVSVQAQILALLADMKDRFRMAMLLVTHDLGVVAGSCDDVLVLCEGKAVEAGTVDTVLTDPQHPYTRGLLACVPRIDAKVSRLATVERWDSESEEAALERT